MLKELRLTNVRSFKDARLPLGRVTLLIGANAAGKTNLVEALRFLVGAAVRIDPRLSDGDLPARSGLRGEPASLFRMGAERLTLTLTVAGEEERAEATYAAALRLRKGAFEAEEESIRAGDVSMTFRRRGQALAVEVVDSSNGERYTSELPSLPIFFLSLYLHRIAAFAIERNGPIVAVEAILRASVTVTKALDRMAFHAPIPALMRGFCPISRGPSAEDGSNTSAVLYDLIEAKASVSKATILDLVRELPEQDIEDLRFSVTETEEVKLMLRERVGEASHWIPADLLSDGTLRVLALAAVIYSVPAGSLVVIEDVDDGIHPSRLGRVLERLREVAEARELQLLLTTHNPALIDAATDATLADVVCCWRHPQEGDSRLTRLLDLDRAPELFAQGPLGQLMTRGIVERFVRDTTTPEERQQKAFDWLRKLKEGAAK